MADTINDNNAAAIAGVDARWIKASSGKITLSSTQNASYSLDANDTADYFKLTVSRSSNVIIKLESQGGNANVSLLDSDGTTQSNSVGSSNNNSTGLTDVIISDSLVPLQAGQDYYIRVDASNPTNTINYTLTIDTLTTSRSDILWRDYSSGDNYLWKMDNARRISSTSPERVTPNFRIEAVQDFNGDGNLDYVWRDRASGYNSIWFMDAAGIKRIGAVVLPVVNDPNWRIAGAADFNRDGNTDLLWEHIPTNQTLAWLMNDKAQRTGYMTINSPQKPGTSVQSVQDFNKDGMPDIFYRDFTTGNNSIRLLNNQGGFLSDIKFPPVTDKNWWMYGMADFNGDDKLDLLWRNQVTGQNIIWYMDQTQRVSTAALPTITTNFQIASVLTSAIPVDLAGNTAAEAFNIGKLNGTAQYNDQIGGKDKTDFYSFTLDVASKVDITAIGTALAATTNFQITTANGTAVSLVSTANGANQQKLANVTLNPGTYFVRLQSTSTSSIDYSISIGTGIAQLPVNLFPVAPLALKNTDSTPILATQAVSVRTPFLFDLDYIVKYTGSPTNSFKVGFFLSTDATITTNDYRLDTNNDGQRNTNDVATIAGLAPDTNGSRTQRLTLPGKDDAFWDTKGDGTYYIGIIVDPENEITELDAQGNPKENDNVLGTSVLVKDSRLPDLIGGGFNVVQSSASKGETITVSGNILNIGKGSSDAQKPVGAGFTAGFYLSTDQTFSFDDVELGSGTFAAIAANSQISFNSSINTDPTKLPYFIDPIELPPTWAGYQSGGRTYYVLMVVDPGTELNEVEGGALNNTTSDTIFINV
jgi:hypothetical protein